MNFTEKAILSQVTVSHGTRTINVRTDTVVERDGVELSRQPHRKVYTAEQKLELAADLGSDYATYSGMVDALWATTPQAIIVIPPVTPRQIRLALSRAGLRSSVEAAVSAGNQDLKDWYEYSTEFQRNQPLVEQMGTALGQTSEQLDDLWKLAATL